MKEAILLAADIIRKLDRARLQCEVSTLDNFIHPLEPDREPSSLPVLLIRVPDNGTNLFQPCTAIGIAIQPGAAVPTVRVLNLDAYRSAKAIAEATGHTLTMFQARLERYGASFPMKVLD